VKSWRESDTLGLVHVRTLGGGATGSVEKRRSAFVLIWFLVPVGLDSIGGAVGSRRYMVSLSMRSVDGLTLAVCRCL
jgi:hypothetical protein